MQQMIQRWFHRYFSDPEAVLLFFILLLGFSAIIFLGGILAPVLAGIAIAYLLEGLVVQLQKWRVPRFAAVLIVFCGFLGILFVALIGLLPLFWKQMAALFDELPQIVMKVQQLLQTLSERFPDFFSKDQLRDIVNSTGADIRNWGQVVVKASVSSITGIIVWVVYLILVPLLVFFFLKDRRKLLTWLANFLPKKRGVLEKVSLEVNQQIGNYIRGKVIEIILVGIATYLVFWFFGLQYSVLLASLVGLSVLIPYVGAVVVTIPVFLVAYLQWGWEPALGYLMLAYLILQGLDANILIPLLFSEAVNLHPVAIIVATLFFGGIWGFWGVFFAIPLATLVKAVINAWPKPKNAD
jgi:putative permease